MTASFILSWVIIGPALISLGVGGPEVAMFIFYYAVLSEVSPPTALAAVASAAITGGKVIPTMMQACKYTLPAFLAPMAFVVSDNGSLLLRGDLIDVVWATLVCAAAVAALAVVTTGWMFGPTGMAAKRPVRPGGPAAALPRPDLHRRRLRPALRAAVLLHLVRRKRSTSRPAEVSTTDTASPREPATAPPATAVLAPTGLGNTMKRITTLAGAPSPPR